MTSISPIVHDDLGIALLPSNILAQGTENLYQSALLNLESHKLPSKVYNLPWSPNATSISAILNPPDGFWIQRMYVVRSAILNELEQTTKEKCFVLCLSDLRCGAITYDPESSKCMIQTGNYYRMNALVEGSTSATAKLNCILENHHKTRSQLCGSSNELFRAVLDAMISQHQLLVGRYLQKYRDVKEANDLNLATSQITDMSERPK